MRSVCRPNLISTCFALSGYVALFSRLERSEEELDFGDRSSLSGLLDFERLCCSSSSSAGRGIPSSRFSAKASKQSSSFWKAGLEREDIRERG